VIRAALELADYGLRTAGVEVVADLAPDLSGTEADESQLQQVFANLFVNAQQACWKSRATDGLQSRRALMSPA
jgi:C4-dicarboxylate-specific signal transduction histidine kinase